MTNVESRLLRDEGECLYAYRDHLGLWTIGAGILIDQRGGGITVEESRYLLRNRIKQKLAECESRFEWFHGLDETRQDVIVCMAYQLGTQGVAGFGRMIDAIKARDYDSAAQEMIDSDWHEQTPGRCETMARIMRTGVWE